MIGSYTVATRVWKSLLKQPALSLNDSKQEVSNNMNNERPPWERERKNDNIGINGRKEASRA
jgi:hypothetical protein